MKNKIDSHSGCEPMNYKLNCTILGKNVQILVDKYYSIPKLMLPLIFKLRLIIRLLNSKKQIK